MRLSDLSIDMRGINILLLVPEKDFALTNYGDKLINVYKHSTPRFPLFDGDM